jgi:catechol 2,3-dioxygenase-like lactoylglutathione lyase family enzyme
MPPERTKVLTSTPSIVVSNLEKSLEFYRGKLGFGDPGVWGEPPCFAMLNRNGFDLMLTLAENESLVRPNGPHGIWDLYLGIADVAAEAEALQSAGVKLERGPEDAFYGMREIEVLDPDGYRICLAQNTKTE